MPTAKTKTKSPGVEMILEIHAEDYSVVGYAISPSTERREALKIPLAALSAKAWHDHPELRAGFLELAKDTFAALLADITNTPIDRQAELLAEEPPPGAKAN